MNPRTERALLPTERAVEPSDVKRRFGRIESLLLNDVGARVTFYLGVIALWVIVSLVRDRFPDPAGVIGQLKREFERGEVFSNFGYTLQRFVLGVAISCVIGIAAGLLMGMSRTFRSLGRDIVVVGVTMPAIPWAFLAVMWFGFSYRAPVVATVLVTVPFVVTNVEKGVQAVSRELHDMSTAYGVSLIHRIRELILPAIAGYTIAAVRFALIVGWNAVLLVEWFGSNTGVGFRARYWYNANQADGFIAWVVLFVGFVVLVDRLLLERLARKAFSWRGDESP